MKKIFFGAIVIISLTAQAQIRTNYNVSQASVNDTSAFLDASSSSTFNGTANNGKGLVFPRTDLTQITALKLNGLAGTANFPTRMDGMVVYNTATGTSGIGSVAVSPGFYYYSNSTTNLNGGTWIPFSPTASNGGGKDFWTLSGNGGTTPVTLDANNAITAGNFIGTTDASNLTLATNKVAKLVVGDQSAVVGDNPTAFNFVLDVLGKARFRNGIVTEKSTYPDYVFEQYFTGASKINPNYQFKSLAETEKFVKENNHLPGVTKITEFTKDGQKYMIDAAQLSIENLEKVEELYLHTIQQQKEIDALKAELAEIKKAISNK